MQHGNALRWQPQSLWPPRPAALGPTKEDSPSKIFPQEGSAGTPPVSFIPMAVAKDSFIWLAFSVQSKTLSHLAEIAATASSHSPLPHYVRFKSDLIMPSLNSYSALLCLKYWASQVAHMVKNLCAMQETWVRSLGWEDPLEEGTATHSSILAWKIPWTEEPCRLQSMGSQRVGHDWATKHSTAQLAISPTCWTSSIHFTGCQHSHGPENLHMKFRTKNRCSNKSHTQKNRK